MGRRDTPDTRVGMLTWAPGLHPARGRADTIEVSTCPACLTAVAVGAGRCPACGIPFTTPAQPRPDLSGVRRPRAMIPPPPLPRPGAVAADPLATSLGQSPAARPQPTQPRPTQPAPEPQPAIAAYAVGASFVTASFEPEPARWWQRPRLRDPRVLVGVPSALVAIAVAALLVTGSRAPEVVEVRVPDVTGMDVLDAKNVLDGRGLTAPFAGLGTVVAQQPAAGEEVRPGTAVVLTVEPYR